MHNSCVMRRHDPALRLIIALKFGRAVVVIAASLLAIALVLAGLAPVLHHWAERFSARATGDLSTLLSNLLVASADPRHMLIAAGVLALDGVLLVVEGWALLHRKLWGAWLVVAATTALIPFELFALLRHATVLRGLVLGVNVLIVLWVLRHALLLKRQFAGEAPVSSAPLPREARQF